MKKGDLLILSSGEYSDYGIVALFRAEQDFDARAVLATFLAEFPDQCKDYAGDEHKFAAWLSAKGYIADVPYTEWHLGSYGCFDRADEPKALRWEAPAS